MRVISKTQAGAVEFPPNSGNVYEPGEDGVFDMPEHVAAEITRRHAAHWALESATQANAARARTAKLRSPQESAKALADLADRVAALEAKVAEHEAALTAPFDGADDEDAQEPADEAGAAPAEAPPAVKPQASKQAASKRAAAKPE